MKTLFDYKFIETTLIPSSKTLKITIKSDYLQSELLFELDSILAWASNHLEILSIFITTHNKNLENGLDINQISKNGIHHISNLYKKLNKLVYGMFLLPQTLIFDLGSNMKGLSIDLSLAADYRLMDEKGSLLFDQLLNGHTSPCAMALLTNLISPVIAQKYIMISDEISAQKAFNDNFIDHLYNNQTRELTLNKLLLQIKKQAPIQRIQTKKVLFDSIRKNISESMDNNLNSSLSALVTDDWKQTNYNYMLPRDFSKILKEEEKTKNDR